MKKLCILLTAVLLMGTLCACGAENADMEEAITVAPGETDAPAVAEENPEREYAFLYEGTQLLPGDPFDPTALPEAEGIYEAPSCAIAGMDIVYRYDGFEITAMDDGTGAVLYSVYFLSPELETPEGLHIGDSEETVLSLYGEAAGTQDGAWVWTGNQSQLILILNSGTVSSIEYRMAA